MFYKKCPLFTLLRGFLDADLIHFGTQNNVLYIEDILNLEVSFKRGFAVYQLYTCTYEYMRMDLLNCPAS